MRGLKYGMLLIMAAFVVIQLACKSNDHSRAEQKDKDSLAIREAYSTSPVLSPTESLKRMQLEDGFAIKLVVAEPLVNSPVALAFDHKGRIWVAEMEGYMPDTAGRGEERPTGKIVILEDKDNDGMVDGRRIFMDSLVLPRALSFIEDGILIAEPPKLWFVKIENDRPGKKTLVDPAYTEGGNVEHQPNGLFRALDNWIYNAESAKRYRKKGDRWLIEKTHVRGQWSLSQDDHGRLFYNNNSENLLADYFAPGFGSGNVNQRRVAGFSEKVVPDNKVYPLRPTPGVNRGYMEGVLDDSLRLVNFTAASGPVLYRGDLFGNEYSNNAFVGEPAGNLIKRNIVEEKGYKIVGKQAYQGREFLSSTDERFRPVTLYNGPDGALYVVDMYRGIIQHKTYLTDYLKNEIISRKLYEPINYGRIYKIIPKNKIARPVILPENPAGLVNLLQHPNGWVRDKAQQMLIDGKFTGVIPTLRQFLKQTGKPVTVAHAVWTLEGLGALQPGDVLQLINQSSWPVRMQGLNVMPGVITKNTYRQFVPVLERLLKEEDTLAAPYVAFLAGTIRSFDKQSADRILINVMKKYPRNVFVTDAVISVLRDREAEFLKQVIAFNPDTSLTINRRLRNVLNNISERKNSRNMTNLAKEFPKGSALFKSVCQTCHGADGNGIKSLAPPLNRSEWVTGDKEKLLSIVLFGLTGPIKVRGTVYEAPEIAGDMPGIGYNKELSDEDIAQLLSFIRKAWSNNASKISASDVTAIRNKYKGRKKAFTMRELK